MILSPIMWYTMIENIRGVLSGKEKNWVILEVGGLGFKIFMTQRGIDRLPAAGSEVKLFSRLIVREDSLDFYGFIDQAELRIFELLNSVGGVGPKSALAVLGVAEPAKLQAAIKENRPDLLVQASGIGRKTAERIILELRNKIDATASGVFVAQMESDVDLVDALCGLGYRRDQAASALQKIGKGAESIEDRLKAALAILSGKSAS